MKKVLSKLRIYCFIFILYLKLLLSKITMPFEFIVEFIKQYQLSRKINNESKDNWERHMKTREFINQYESELRKKQFFNLKVKFACSFWIASSLTNFYVQSKEPSNKGNDEFLSKLDSYREEFKTEKNNLIELMEMFNDYDEITFDKDIKAEIIDWKFEDRETVEEIRKWEEKFANYMHTLNLI